MAKIGLKYVVAAKLNVEGGTYSEGRVLGKAITADITINSTDDVLRADDEVAERVKEFQSGTEALGIDDLTLENHAWLLGHAVTASSGSTPATMVCKSDDVAPYVGNGFYAPRLKNGVKTWRAIWLCKVLFAEPQDTMNTKGENITFGTPTLNGSIDQLSDGTWKEEAEFSSEAAAKAWCDEKAGITHNEIQNSAT